MIALQEIQARYPYQFAGPTINLNVLGGWHSLFAQLCEDTDQALGENKQGFPWVGVFKKYGEACVDFELAATAEGRADRRRRLEIRTRAFEEARARVCCVCGQPGAIREHLEWLSALCEVHHHQQQAGRLTSAWLDTRPR
jgi:hypothetical protein